MTQRIMWRPLVGPAVVMVLALLWEVLVRTGVLDFQYLPAPSEIIAAVGPLWADGQLLQPLVHTVVIVLEAWALAMVVGILLGVWLGTSPRMWRYTMASVEVLRTLPVVAVVPVVLLVMGPTNRSELVVAAYAACWPVVISVAQGMQDVPERLMDVGDQLCMSLPRKVITMMLPSAAPIVLAVARLAMGISLIVVILAEMIGNPQGIGAGITDMQMALQPERMWVFVLVAALLGVTFNWALVLVAHTLGGNLLRRGDQL